MIQQSLHQPVTRETVPEDQRMAVVERLFGIHFPLKLEPVIYGITERMADEYSGGYWQFYNLSNGGWYMAPDEDRVFHVKCDNMYEGDLSADATTVLGVVPLLQDVFWVGMAITIMAGLTFGTVITMVLVPTLYATFYRIPSPRRAEAPPAVETSSSQA